MYQNKFSQASPTYTMLTQKCAQIFYNADILYLGPLEAAVKEAIFIFSAAPRSAVFSL